MSLEQEVADLTESTNNLTNTVAGKVAEIDQKVASKEAEVDSFLDQAGVSLKQSSGGALRCFKTAGGQDSWFYGFGKCTWLDLRPDGVLGSATDIHEAFLENGIEKSSLWIAAFQATLLNGEIVSQPGLIPRTSRTFAQELSECASTNIAGIPDGSHRLMSNWDWSLIYHWIAANGYQPGGNSNYGKSHEKTHISGIGADKTNSGSLGDMSSHSGTHQGVFDLVGNVMERVSGMELRDGEIYLADDNGDVLTPASFNSAGHYYSSSSSTSNGTPTVITDGAAIVRNGPVGDNSHSDSCTLDGEDGFSVLLGASSLQMKRACLAPLADTTDLKGFFSCRNYGTRIPLRGGSWKSLDSSGMGAIMLGLSGDFSGTNMGFRSAFLS